LLHYLLIGWPWKEYEIKSALNAESKAAYLLLFHNMTVDVKNSSKEFEKLYRKWYGRRHFIAPVLLISVFVSIQSYFVGETVAEKLFNISGYKIDPIAIEGFFGAYIYGLFGILLVDIRSVSLLPVIYTEVPFGYLLQWLSGTRFLRSQTKPLVHLSHFA
jgi:hypothetical protein